MHSSSLHEHPRRRDLAMDRAANAARDARRLRDLAKPSSVDRRGSRSAGAIALALLCLGSSAAAEVIHVDLAAPPGGNGSSWQSALRHLGDAIGSAAPGDEIRIAGGVHRPDESAAAPGGTGDRDAVYVIEGSLTIRGGYAGLAGADPDLNDPEVHPTILSGDLDGNDASGVIDDNSKRILLVPDESTGSVVLERLTISGANGLEGLRVEAPGVSVSECRFVGNRSSVAGAGIRATQPLELLHGSSFVANTSQGGIQFVGGTVFLEGEARSTSISHCYFEGNSAGPQGGAICYGDDVTIVTPSITDCVFVGNTGPAAGTVATYGGVRPTIARCLFVDGPLGPAGGHVNVYSAPVTILDCHFQGNTGGGFGAIGVFCNWGCSASEATIFAGSRFTENWSGFRSAAALLTTATQVSNTIFSNNIALNSPGAIEPSSSALSNFAHVSITGSLPSAIWVFPNTTVHNSILWNNGTGYNGTGSAFSHCIVDGGAPGGTAILTDDPLFLGPDAHDLRLAVGSPAIDAGSVLLLPPDVADQDGDGDTSEPLPVDHDGAPRVQGAAPDLGAFEGGFAFTPPTASAEGIEPGASVELSPGTNPALPSVAALLTNVDGPQAAEATLAQIGWNPHPEAPGLTEEGLVGKLDTTIADGAHRTQIRIPITLATLWPDVDPASMRVSIWDPTVNAWRLAVARNLGAAENGSGGPVGSFSFILGSTGTEPMVPTALGDHGVYWNGLAVSGFVFANVDRAGEFGVGRALCTADLDGDGVIDGGDLGAIIAAWGSSGSAAGAADLDGNGVVDGGDLAALIAAWGPCAAGLSDQDSDESVDGGLAGRFGKSSPVVPSRPSWFDASRADLTSDGRVDGADLGMLLAHWGVPDRRVTIAADFNGDGVVDGADLGLLLGAWTE